MPVDWRYCFSSAQLERALDRLSELLAAAADTDSDRSANTSMPKLSDSRAGEGGVGGGISIVEMRMMLEASVEAAVRAIAVPILEQLADIRASAGNSVRRASQYANTVRFSVAPARIRIAIEWLHVASCERERRFFAPRSDHRE